MKKRYLIRFSYLGNHFLSCSKQSKDVDLTSVVGALELPLRSLRNISLASEVHISSRTDRGVHALQNTAHFDLQASYNFDGFVIVNALNKFYFKKGIGLRVSDICQVSADFNARKFAKLRTYLYRIAVPKSDIINLGQHAPISEVTRCYFLRKPGFDIEAVQKGLSLLIGTHNFISFTGKPTRQVLVRTPIRRIISFSISQGAPLRCALYEPFSCNFDYWDFVVEGRSFNYNQVRRMVAALIAVGQGQFPYHGLQKMLDSQLQPTEWIMSKIAPACGLYLMKVLYNEEDLSVDRKPKERKLKKQREMLNHTSTRVTTVEGKTLREEILNGEILLKEIPVGNQSCPGFVIDTKPDLQVAEIIKSSLYLGSQDVTQDFKVMTDCRITHVISLGVTVPPLPQLPALSYSFIPALDVPDEQINRMLNEVLPLMDDIINKGGCVLVHCNAGVSRAPTVVIAYLMTFKGLKFNEASALVKEKRPASKPNAGFVQQLLSLEGILLKGEKKEMAKQQC
ncbi:tRNA pseudouridine synthase-like 1 [Frankliniella fusca]|uniref:tRNA pseudouridine synthase-like 1 n=1 Tax=Frankliniella fusca TaxID=407009 RepID=A0AAE1LUD5_9NEOP|nr:tRNA pseudouridine synthase-like 1 [Frankliniella fusca]